MEYLQYAIDFVLHIDVHMAELVAQYGMWIYAILFVIIFCETGLVVTPFLPGDSLLFAAGFFAAPDAQTGVSALPLFALLPVELALQMRLRERRDQRNREKGGMG